MGKKIIHFIFCLLLISETAYAGNIDTGSADDKYAWGENIGWINLEPPLGLWCDRHRYGGERDGLVGERGLDHL
jgi:hypothetical protein